MQIRLPIETVFILHTLQAAGYQAYLVGGAVRDMLMSHLSEHEVAATDFDFTTDADPEVIKSLFPESFYENDFGTVSVTPTHIREQANLPLFEQEIQSYQKQQSINVAAASKLHSSLQPVSSSQTSSNEHPYEITTFRTDGTYSDFRRPESVSWGTSLEEDLARRDFTINAMAISIELKQLEVLLQDEDNRARGFVTLDQDQFGVIDPHSGLQDVNWRIVRTVGTASQRFQEDALRMLRAIRFAVQLGFSIDEETYAALKQHSYLLRHISGERIRDEFFKMLLSPRPKQALEHLEQTGLLAEFLPELLEAKDVQQGGHHTTDVWTHSLDAVEASPSSDPVVKLATLLHDIDKPTTFNRTGQGSITFYNHEVVGARTAKKIAERLKLSKKDIDRVFILVRYHMFHYQPEQTDAAIRRFMRKVGLDNVNDILDLREADRLGSGARKTSWRLEEMKQRMIQQLHQPFDVTDLAINGHDLINELELAPGPLIGQILTGLLEEVLESPELNNKETLLTRARALAKQAASPLSTVTTRK